MHNLLRAAALLTAIGLVAAEPPPTPMAEHVDRMFGMTFSDPYHWMEDGGARFDDWLTAQAAYTRARLDAIPGRAGLLAQLGKLDAGETQVSGATVAGGNFVYSKTRPEDAVAKIFVRPLAGGAERVLVDPSRFDADGQPAQLDYWSIADDGRHIAFGVSLGRGDRHAARHGRDHGRQPAGGDGPHALRPAELDRQHRVSLCAAASAAARRQAAAERCKSVSASFGDSVADDVPAFGPGLVADRKLPVDFFFRGVGSVVSSIAVGEYDAGLGNSPKALFVADEAKLGNHAAWHEIASLDDDIRGVVLHGKMLYLRSAQDAPRQRIIRVSAVKPDLSKAEIVLPEGAGTHRLDGRGGRRALCAARSGRHRRSWCVSRGAANRSRSPHPSRARSWA